MPTILSSAARRRHNRMKHMLTYLLLAGMLLCLTGCRLNYMEPEEMREFLDDVAENIGSSQITDDEDLIGTRVLADSEDSYAGKYTAECSHITGRDVVFGGASIHDRAIFLSGTTKPESGKATIRIRLNNEVFELESDADGCFETILKLDNGGNYIMVVYEDFSGSVEMMCEYVAQGDTDE